MLISYSILKTFQLLIVKKSYYLIFVSLIGVGEGRVCSVGKVGIGGRDVGWGDWVIVIQGAGI